MSELLPCPFCGSTEAKIRPNSIGDVFVQCGECGAATNDANCETDAKAVRRWNRRATPDVVLVPIEPTNEMIHQATLAAVRENGGMELSIYKMWQAMLLASPSSGSARG